MQGRPAIVLVLCVLVLMSGLSFSSLGWSQEAQPAPEAEPELVIVKYGSLYVKSQEPGAKVYIDDTYKGGADSIIESIVAGQHVISVRVDAKAVSGTFSIRKNETLRLEARFSEGKLIVSRDAHGETHAAQPKKPAEATKPEKPKKPVPEPKKAENKTPVEERRHTHLTVMKINYERSDGQQVKVEHKANPSVISKFSASKSGMGKYYRTKQGVLLCDREPCELTWRISFIYTDETSKADALLLNWKETVFNGITPAGTSRQDLECCLNGQCWKMQYKSKGEATQEFDIGGKYRLSWEKGSIVIRRADIMKEILEAGRSLDDY
jgi:hypothetical protein